ncbi:MAG: ABC transporter permease, partial [Flavobacteriales bacterium]|nr:ABC transporter permease [Flavobacteriales bacterium]
MLIAISLLSFVISINAPGDPVERLAKSSESEGSAQEQSGTSKRIKQELRKKLGLDLPIFYLSITDLSSSDTLYRIQDKYHKATLEHLTHKSGNWQLVSDYYKELLNLQKIQEGLNSKEIYNQNQNVSLNTVNEAINQVGFEINSLLETSDDELIDSTLNRIDSKVLEYSFFKPLLSSFKNLKSINNNLIDNNKYHFLKISYTSKWKTYIPAINWYGSKNQYHLWLFGNGNDRHGLIRGDLGISYIDSQPISTKIWSKIGISFSLSLISIFIAYLISIPIGIYSAYKKDSAIDKGFSLILFILYSMPSFFVGTLLLLQFANPDNFAWFPVSGIQDPTLFDSDWSFWTKIKHRMPFLILPIITYTYSSFAFLSRIMRVGMIDIVNQDYIRTARAKGLGEAKVILKHALRNSLLPVITVFAAIFPMAIGGSIIIEVIFSIPGMGLEVYNSILNYDYPMIITVFTLSGFLTMVGYLVADILYAVVDPRISYK